MYVRDQITSDLAVAAAKVAPPAAVATATMAGSISPQSILVWLSILYTATLLTTTVVKNWGEWINWWKGRFSDIARLVRWLRGG